MSSKIIEVSFNLYFEKGLDFSKAKVYCCENMLRNILNCIEYIEGDYRILQITDKHLQKVIEYIKYKYPHSEEKMVNKELSRIISKVDIYDSNENDISFASGAKFEYREDGDYSS